METRQRISAKAKEMFMRYGIRTVSMDDIAGSLGISKKTIYASFVDKDALVDSIIAEHLSESEAVVGEIHLRSEDAVQEMWKSSSATSTRSCSTTCGSSIPAPMPVWMRTRRTSCWGSSGVTWSGANARASIVRSWTWR
ncbi:MAG: TetR/AcrR family transcriptional regulator [Chitinophagia bacterium]|nr:TetR/AcrR family transcriptional regulator [Chitinophagia bacterium]